MAVKPKPESPVTAHRRRQAARGLRRVEVQVRNEDAELLKRIAAALTDTQEAPAARAYLVERFGPAPKDFKQFLTWGPSFEELDLKRSRDTGREIDW